MDKNTEILKWLDELRDGVANRNSTSEREARIAMDSATMQRALRDRAEYWMHNGDADALRCASEMLWIAGYKHTHVSRLRQEDGRCLVCQHNFRHPIHLVND